MLPVGATPAPGSPSDRMYRWGADPSGSAPHLEVLAPAAAGAVYSDIEQ